MSNDREKIPYKIYLEESEMPKQWYNVRADMKNKPAPLLNPGTHKPMTFDELRPVFCDELIKQELDDTTAYFDIPEEILNFYKMYRPSPVMRAYNLEKDGTIILPQDCVYTQEVYGPPAKASGLLYDSIEFFKSIEKLRKLQKKYNAKIVFAHDYEFFKTLKTVPEYYE